MGKIPDRWMQRGSPRGPRPDRKPAPMSPPPATAKEIQILKERWLPYSTIGSRVAGTRFIAFKVPLKQALNNFLRPMERFTIPDLLQRVPKLGLVIDLTQTDRYYDYTEIVKNGVDYIKIACKGQTVPSFSDVQAFFTVVDYYLDRHSADDTIIGVHCTHGVNRTGYLLCRYMIQRMGIPLEEAIKSVDLARGHSMERPNYIYDLRNHMASIPKSFVIPEGLIVGKRSEPPRIDTSALRHVLRPEPPGVLAPRGRLPDRSFHPHRATPPRMPGRDNQPTSSRPTERRNHDPLVGDYYYENNRGNIEFNEYGKFNQNRDMQGGFRPKSPERGPPPRRARPDEEMQHSRRSHDYNPRPLSPPRPYPPGNRDKIVPPSRMEEEPGRKPRAYARDDSFRREDPHYHRRVNSSPDLEHRRRRTPPVHKSPYSWDDSAGPSFPPKDRLPLERDARPIFVDDSPPLPKRPPPEFDRERRDRYVEPFRKDWGTTGKFNSPRDAIPRTEDDFARDDRRGYGPPVEREFPRHPGVKRERKSRSPLPGALEFKRKKPVYEKPIHTPPHQFPDLNPQPRFQRDDSGLRRDKKPFIPKAEAHPQERFTYEKRLPPFQHKGGPYARGGIHRPFDSKPVFPPHGHEEMMPPQEHGFARNQHVVVADKNFAYKRPYERQGPERFDVPPKRFRSRSPNRRERSPPSRRMRSLSPRNRGMEFVRHTSPDMRGPPRRSPPREFASPPPFRKRNFSPQGRGINVHRDRFSPVRHNAKHSSVPVWECEEKEMHEFFPEDADDCRSILIQKRMTKREELSPPRTPIKKRIDTATKSSPVKKPDGKVSVAKKVAATKAKVIPAKKPVAAKKPVFSRLGNEKEPVKSRLKPLDSKYRRLPTGR